MRLREKIVLALTALLIILAGLGGYRVLQLKGEKVRLTKQIKDKQAQIRVWQEEYDLDRLQKELNNLNSQLTTQDIFPSKYPSPELDNFLIKQAQEMGIRLMSLKVGEAGLASLSKGVYQQHRREIESQGELLLLLNFLSKLEEVPYPIIVDKLSLTFNGQEWEGRLSFSLYTKQ